MIGVFDSGIGGFTVARAIIERLPELSMMYLGDTAHAPYGDRSPHEITDLALADAQWLVDQGASMIVIACHTISTLSYEMLKARLSVPVLGMVNPVVISAMKHSRRGKIMVIGTKATISSGVYQSRITQYAANRGTSVQVTALATPQLVPLIEKNSSAEEIEHALQDVVAAVRESGSDTLILGCTHYPLIQNHIERLIGPKVVVIDPGSVMADHVVAYVQQHDVVVTDDLQEPSHRHVFYVTKKTPHTDAAAAFILGEGSVVEEIAISGQ